jgi:hypothetical protein
MLSAEEKLEALLRAGKITENDLWAVDQNDQFKLARICDWLHAIFCERVHPDECPYYNEQEKPDTWAQPCHKHWLEETDHVFECIQILHLGTKSNQLLDEFFEAIKEEATSDLANLLKCAAIYGMDLLDYLASDYETRLLTDGTIVLKPVVAGAPDGTVVTIPQGFSSLVLQAPAEPPEIPASIEHRTPPHEAPVAESTQTSTTCDSAD